MACKKTTFTEYTLNIITACINTIMVVLKSINFNITSFANNITVLLDEKTENFSLNIVQNILQELYEIQTCLELLSYNFEKNIYYDAKVSTYAVKEFKQHVSEMNSTTKNFFIDIWEELDKIAQNKNLDSSDIKFKTFKEMAIIEMLTTYINSLLEEEK